MRLTMREIIVAASEIAPVTIEEILSARRSAYWVNIRAAVVWIARQQGYSFPRIARAMNRICHSSMIHLLRKAEYQIERDEDFARFVSRLERHARIRGAASRYNLAQAVQRMAA